ncbi:MAG: tRNA-dihydrouridine synthase family protein [Opitutales bacterium]|nr:tRNA-dihydrouridine synthase family protein [Opitutales bacterium]
MGVFGRGLLTALAPMQDVTDAGFMSAISGFGAPDLFFAEYFRVTECSILEEAVLKTVLSKPGGKSVCAQILGGSEIHIARTIELIKKYPQIEFLDLNLGCPAPKVYRKNAGGGLLKEPEKIRSILKVMRENWGKTLSVKMRLGFDSAERLEELLGIVQDCGADFITLHARTVRQLYRGKVDYEKIAQAVKFLKIPLIANGDIATARQAAEVEKLTGCKGVMIGRGAVRNPWIFRQIKELKSGAEIFKPTLGDVFKYIEKILAAQTLANPKIIHPDSRLKKYLNFVGVSVDPLGEFLRQMRRAQGLESLMEVCRKHLLKNPGAPYADAPYPSLCARPNHEI